MPGTSTPSRLLVFAHRGEAQAFLRGATRVPSPLKLDLYGTPPHLILISGEGLQAVTETLSATLGMYPDVGEVWNFGIAGALNSSLGLHQILTVRTVYAQKMQKEMEFKSFSTANSQAECDLVSARDRVLSKEMAAHLDCFAPLVDREGWAIGSVCARFDKRFRIWKLVSDRPAEAVDCQDIRSRSAEMSERLFDTFKQNEGDTLPADERRPDLPAGFYFTKSQGDVFYSLLDRLSILWQSTHEEAQTKLISMSDVEEISNHKATGKLKTGHLLRVMKNKLNPYVDPARRP